MKIKHSKYSNTGIIFELLIRQITSDTLSGKDSKAINIVKTYFTKSELGKENRIYETLSKYKFLTEAKADIILNSLIEDSKNLNKGLLRKQKYNLIKEISKHYKLEDFFQTKFPNYKPYAALYTLLEIHNSPNPSSPDQIINNKIVILEHLTAKKITDKKLKDEVLNEFETYDKDLRLLTYKVLLEKFNGKYVSLNNNQKIVLREFINSIDSVPKLKLFYNTKINEIKLDLVRLNKKVTNKATQIKLNEVNKLIKPLGKTSNIDNDNLVNLLQYYELLEELKKVNG